MEKSYYIIQISDSHLFSDPHKMMKHVDTEETLLRVLDMISHADQEIAAIVFTGDIADDGSVEAYLRVANYLNQFAIPIYFIPGNHDNLQNIKSLQKENIHYKKSVILGQWNLLFLNSVIEGDVAGNLSKGELDFLRQQLAYTNTKHQAIFLHHHAFPVNMPLFDDIGLKNSDEFLQLTYQYPSVKLVLCGHIHQELQTSMNGIPFLACPSTGLQVKVGAQAVQFDETAFDTLAPGYRWLRLYDNGRFETGVKRLPA